MPGSDLGCIIKGGMVDRHLMGGQVFADVLGQIARYGTREYRRINSQIAFGVGTNGLDALGRRSALLPKAETLSPFSGAKAET